MAEPSGPTIGPYGDIAWRAVYTPHGNAQLVLFELTAGGQNCMGMSHFTHQAKDEDKERRNNEKCDGYRVVFPGKPQGFVD